jgi:hypothetical protein
MAFAVGIVLNVTFVCIEVVYGLSARSIALTGCELRRFSPLINAIILLIVVGAPMDN